MNLSNLLRSVTDWIRTQLELRLVTNRIVVNQKNFTNIFSSTLDSTKEYFIDGIINIDGLSTSINVPETGLELKGFSFDNSQIICTDDSYTLFYSTNSGNLLFSDIAYEISGTSSQVFDLKSSTGNEAIEFSRVNFNNCTSLGTMDNFRQGLEEGTGRFGGTPELTLKGTWSGGYFIDTSIIRSLYNSAYTLYKAGTGFLMSSRFRSNQNIDLPALASFFDFAPSNFVNPSTVQITGAIVSRNGVFDATDTNITPNMSKGNLSADFSNNVGMGNTFVGGTNTVTTEVLTTISASSTYYDLNGTFTESDLQHFDSPSNGKLRHLGSVPRDYKIFSVLSIDGKANDVIKINIRKYINSTASFVDVFQQESIVNNYSGSRDIAQFTIIKNITLDNNDYIYLQVSNETGINNVTAELDSYFSVEER